jgi:hypothetical protein
MRHYLIACVAVIALASAASAETRNLSGFTGVAVADRIEVEVATGDRYRVEIIGSEAGRVRTEVEDGVLRIQQRNRPWFGGTPRIDARVLVTLPAIETLAASRGASLSADDINARAISIAASMGGTIEISGRCSDLSASASMGGSIDADNFQCGTANLSASMGGDMDVFASTSYTASASMGGSISVDGEAQAREVASSMGGSVSRQ